MQEGSLEPEKGAKEVHESGRSRRNLKVPLIRRRTFAAFVLVITLGCVLSWYYFRTGFSDAAFNAKWVGTRHVIEVDLAAEVVIVDGTRNSIDESIRTGDTLSLMLARRIGEYDAYYLFVLKLKRWDRVTIRGEGLEYDAYRSEFNPSWVDSLTGSVPDD
jgi:hypothetical protein